MKRLIYAIIDFFTFGRGLTKTFHGFKLRLPTRYINYFPKNYEKPNFDFLIAHTGKDAVVLDIGAHIGLFAAVAARIAGDKGKVYAFEPAPATFALLQETIRINNQESIVEPRSEAMGLENGQTVFYVSDTVADNSNSLVSYKGDRTLYPIDVTILTVDSFVKSKQLDKVSFLKIDVEGAEYDAIRGAEKTLLEKRPAVILAIHPDAIRSKGDSLEDIYDFLVKCRYTITLDKAPISKEAFCKANDLVDLHLLPA
jgi:FkbM family methyltransferase